MHRRLSGSGKLKTMSDTEQIKDDLVEDEKQLTDADHERVQDKRISDHDELLQKQTEYLYEIKQHFVPEPEEESEQEKRWKKYIAMVFAKICLVITGILAIWDVGTWYLNHLQVKHMARRYATVASEIYYQENNPKVALSFIDRAIELDEKNAEFRYMQAYINGMASVRQLLNLDRPYTKAELDQAHQSLAQAIFLKGLKKKRPEPHILKGQIYLALKEYDRALNEINLAISFDEENEYAYVRLGTLLAEKHESDKSLDAFQKAIEINPDSKWGWLWTGVVLAQQKKDIPGARKAYRKAIEIDGRFDLAWYNCGMTWLTGEKNYEKARELLEKATTLNPDYKEAYYALGMVYGYQNRYEIAKVYMDKAIALDDKFLTAFKWRGIIWGELGNCKESLSDFNKAIELDPKNAGLYLRRAKAYEKLGQLDNAIRDLRFSLEIEPGKERTLLYLGNVFLQAGEHLKAREYYDQALKIRQDYDEAYAQMAKACAALNQIDKAIEAVSTAIKVTDYQPERFYFQRGKLYERAGRKDLALIDYCEARTLRKGYSEAWLSEAKLLKDSGKIEASLIAVNRYIEQRPQDKDAQKLRDELLELEKKESGDHRL